MQNSDIIQIENLHELIGMSNEILQTSRILDNITLFPKF